MFAAAGTRLTSLAESIVFPLAQVLLLPLDRLRGRLLQTLGPLSKPLMMRPELRVALIATTGVLGALLGTLLLPLWMLAISPLVLGVPHLLADVRYLAVRPGLHRRPWLALLVAGPLLLSCFGFGMQAGLWAIVFALLLAPGKSWRKAVGLLPLGALYYLGQRDGFYPYEVGLAHLHNFVGVLLWWLWRPRRQALHLLPLGLLVGICALLLGGALSPPSWGLWWRGHEGLSLAGHSAVLAWTLSADWGLRLVLLYCFAQGVHYAVWLRLVPEEDRARATPRTFRASLAALASDLSWPLLLLALLVFVGLAVWAIFDLYAARVGYFRLATFHGYLELSVLSLWWVAGHRPCGLRPTPLPRRAVLSSPPLQAPKAPC